MLKIFQKKTTNKNKNKILIQLKMRCFCCNKKTHLEFKCKCHEIFCSKCLLPEIHSCKNINKFSEDSFQLNKVKLEGGKLKDNKIKII